MPLTCVGDEGQIHRVHHQLDRHEDGDAVLARQHAENADGKEDGAQNQKVLGRYHRASPFP